MANETGEERVTLIVPTVYRRARLFSRVLRYFDSAGFRTPIIVSDHSPAGEEGVISAIAAEHPNLNLTVLRHSPELHFLERLTDCAAKADTPYLHLHADDDFVLRPMLSPLADCMDSDATLVAAMGINIHAEFASRDLSIASKGEIVGEKPFDRLIAQLESYSSVLYALRRRDEMISSMTFAVGRCPDVQFWQYLESCIAALEGSIAVVEDLHYVRERHAEKWSATLVRDRSMDHFPYLILSPEFGPRVAAFRTALIEGCRMRGIAVDEGSLDAGLIHLLYRGFGTMGLPPKRIAIATPEAAQAVAAILWERLATPTDQATIELTRIFALAKE